MCTSPHLLGASKRVRLDNWLVDGDVLEVLLPKTMTMFQVLR